MLRDIVIGLQSIHNEGLVHHDFHSGNILRHGYGNDSNNLDTYISDLGLCHPVDKNHTKSKVIGVLPYLAPEVLRGEKYTKAADIYSLGIIMWEITTSDKPFYDRSHDNRLAIEICSGLRPKLMPGTPECYAQVMQKCWNADPLSRPTAEELFVMLKQFKEISNYRTQIGEAELIRFGVIENILSTRSHKSIHPEAIYSSRLLEFSDLPQPKNADPVSIPTPNAYRPVRRRANSVTFHNRRPNSKQTNRRSVQIQSVSSTFNERRHSRSFSSDEVAESMRRLSLSLGPSKDLNAINEELFED
ncbi:kinase-like domain-containing protein [Rhizophagus diaphanus]|nr:kinase-like domain-containing protein [Rhizophagus diaphanus] [Rhizophagus sp. MUCL 43196]